MCSFHPKFFSFFIFEEGLELNKVHIYSPFILIAYFALWNLFSKIFISHKSTFYFYKFKLLALVFNEIGNVYWFIFIIYVLNILNIWNQYSRVGRFWTHSSHKNIKNISTSGIVPHRTQAKDPQTPERTRKLWTCFNVGWKNNCFKKREEATRPAPLGRSWRTESFCTLGRPSLVGRSRTEKELQRIREEHNNWLVAGRTEWDLKRMFKGIVLCTPAWNVHLLVQAGAVCWNGLENRLHERSAVAAQRQLKGAGEK